MIAAISLALAQWGSLHHPTATFFLLVTRGWELAIGACIAFYFVYRQQSMRSLLSHQSVDEAFSLLGLLMIAYAVFFFDKHIPFPGFYAMVPSIGTGLIILFSSEQTMVGRLLGLKPLVGIGLVSYSAYLWHQPLYNVFSLSTGSTSYQIFQERNKNAYQALDRIGEYPNLFRVYPENIFCNNDINIDVLFKKMVICYIATMTIYQMQVQCWLLKRS